MKNYILPPILILFTFFNTICQNVKFYLPKEKIEYDTIPYMVKDKYFEQAYKEIEAMFDGRIEYSLKRAQFLTEWAYLEGTLNYAKFSHDIDSIIDTLNNFIDINNFRKYQTAPNFAVFNYFTKASIMNGNKAFTYDFEDPMGRNNFSKQF